MKFRVVGSHRQRDGDEIAQRHQFGALLGTKPAARNESLRVSDTGETEAWIAMDMRIAFERDHLHRETLRQPRGLPPDRPVTDYPQRPAPQRLGLGEVMADRRPLMADLRANRYVMLMRIQQHRHQDIFTDHRGRGAAGIGEYNVALIEHAGLQYVVQPGRHTVEPAQARSPFDQILGNRIGGHRVAVGQVRRD